MENENFSQVQMYVQQSIIDKKDKIIRQQQAEIERLRAALQEIGHHRITPENKDYIAAHEMAIMAQRALGLVDSDGRPIQQQPETPQESLTPAELSEMAGTVEAAKVECAICGSAIPDEHQREFGLEDMCMDCTANVANARADENRWMYPDR